MKWNYSSKAQVPQNGTLIKKVLSYFPPLVSRSFKHLCDRNTISDSEAKSMSEIVWFYRSMNTMSPQILCFIFFQINWRIFPLCVALNGQPRGDRLHAGMPGYVEHNFFNSIIRPVNWLVIICDSVRNISLVKSFFFLSHTGCLVFHSSMHLSAWHKTHFCCRKQDIHWRPIRFTFTLRLK